MTPIQILIRLSKTWRSYYKKGTIRYRLISEVINDLESALPDEQHEIENAYKAGYSEGCNTIDPEGRKYKNAEDYYEKTFNQNQSK